MIRFNHFAMHDRIITSLRAMPRLNIRSNACFCHIIRSAATACLMSVKSM